MVAASVYRKTREGDREQGRRRGPLYAQRVEGDGGRKAKKMRGGPFYIIFFDQEISKTEGIKSR